MRTRIYNIYATIFYYIYNDIYRDKIIFSGSLDIVESFDYNLLNNKLQQSFE